MEKYINVMSVEATPATRYSGDGYSKYVHPDESSIDKGDYDKYIAPATKREPGYKVIYPDGYETWLPKDVFEKDFKKVEEPKPAPNKTKEQIEILEKMQKEAVEYSNYELAITIAKLILETLDRH